MSKEDYVTISVERLRQLEELEARVPHLIEESIKEYKAQSLKRLHERDKMNPTAVAQRARRYVEKHRDLLNERRRQKRKQKAESSPTSIIQIKSPFTLAIPSHTNSSAQSHALHASKTGTYSIGEATVVKFE